MTPTRRALAASLLAAVASRGLAAQQAPPPVPAMPAMPAVAAVQLTPEVIFGADSSGRAPRLLAWSPDGGRLVYAFEDETGDAIWLLDAATGRAEPVLRLLRDDTTAAGETGAGSPETLAGVDSLIWSPRGDALLAVSKGDLYLLPLDTRHPRRLTSTAADEEAPELSPDGTRLAFVRDYDLHLLDLATGRERALTRGGEKNVSLNGTTDWVYWEEIWDRDPTGYWWSPDGRRIAYYHFDERAVPVHPLVDYDPKDPAKTPVVELQKYPRPGEPNPRVRVGVLDLATGRTTWMATGGGEGDYLARVAWFPEGETLAVQRLNREQTRLDLLACQPAGGGCRTLAAQEHPTWVNLGSDFHPLPGGRFLWGSEASGWRRLYLHGADGRPVRALSPEGWALTSLDGVTAAGRAIVTGFETAGLGPARRQVLSLGMADSSLNELEDSVLNELEDSAVDELAREPGWNAALVAPATGNWVHTWSDADHLPRAVVRRGNGSDGGDGGEVAALPRGPAAFDPESLPKWRFGTVPGPGGVALPARWLEPAEVDPARPSRRHPAIVYHYGGPGSQVVSDGWDGRGRDLWHKMMAQRGFGVFMVDNQASLYFGKVGEDRLHRRFGEVNLPAQLALVEHLSGLGWVDPARIGLWGWSGGGSHTLYCVLNRPGVWRAAVAGAPVTDWALYDSIWTERYLDSPRDNPEGYRLSSPVTYAGNLKDRLLVVHGLADDNVHPQNTIALSARWVAAGIPFEDALYPGQKHAFGRESSRHFFTRMTEFFARNLGNNPREENFSAPRP